MLQDVYTQSQIPRGGGHSHRRCVQSCDRGQDTVKGSVKRSRGVLGPMSSNASNQEAWPSLCTCAVNWWSTGQGKKLAVVKWSRPFLDSRSRSSGHGAYGSDPPPESLLWRTSYTNDLFHVNHVVKESLRVFSPAVSEISQAIVKNIVGT